MGLINRLSAMSRRVGLWLLAAGITLAVLFVAVLIYQLSVYQPEPPTVANCQAIQTEVTSDNGAQVYVYQCQRGDNGEWEGYEVWLQKLLDKEWQRLATSPLANGCIGIELDERELLIQYSQSRSDISVASSSFVYDLADGGAATRSVATRQLDRCTLEADGNND